MKDLMNQSQLKVGKKSVDVYNSVLYESDIKQSMRLELLKSVDDKKIKKFFTLGGKDLVDIRLFRQSFNALQIISIERDEFIWKEQIKKSESLPYFLPLNYEFSDFVNQLNHYPLFDLMYLDFNCIWSLKIENDLSKLLENVKKDCVIGLTIVAAHDGIEQLKDTYLFNNVCVKKYDHYKENRIKYIAQTVIKLGEISGKDISLKFSDKYKNSKDSMDIMFFIFKINN